MKASYSRSQSLTRSHDSQKNTPITPRNTRSAITEPSLFLTLDGGRFKTASRLGRRV